MFSMASMIPLRAKIRLDHTRHDSHLGRRPVGDQFSIIDYHHTLYDFGDRADCVIDQDYSEALPLLAAEDIDELLYLGAVEAREWLIEEEKGRSRDESAGNFEQSYLRRTERFRRPIGELREAYRLQ